MIAAAGSSSKYPHGLECEAEIESHIAVIGEVFRISLVLDSHFKVVEKHDSCSRIDDKAALPNRRCIRFILVHNEPRTEAYSNEWSHHVCEPEVFVAKNFYAALPAEMFSFGKILFNSITETGRDLDTEVKVGTYESAVL